MARISTKKLLLSLSIAAALGCGSGNVFADSGDRVEELEAELDAATQMKEFKGIFTIEHEEKDVKTRAVALAVISDLHIEEVVVAETVNHLNEFNETVCQERMRRLFCHMVKLLKLNQQSTHIDTLVLMILGEDSHLLLETLFVLSEFCELRG